MDLASPILPSFVGEEYSIFDRGIEGSHSVFFLLAPNSNLASVFAYIFTAWCKAGKLEGSHKGF